MIEEIEWDSNFFKRKIGRLQHIPPDESALKQVLSDAIRHGFLYVQCRLDASEIKKIQLLERVGFYLCDVGITWAVDLLNRDLSVQQEAAAATLDDTERLKIMSKGLFPESRFYSDPFYSEVEADAMYAAWVENSVKGIAADAVFFVEEAGFIACKLEDDHTGTILLIGVVPGKRRTGTGGILVNKALDWFHRSGVSTVTVRTQVYNLAAMNFYERQAFSIESSNITMAIMFKKGE